jgi:hypothetical protein
VEFDGSVSTGDLRNGHEGAAELDVKTQETPKFPVTLAEFFATLNLLRMAGHRFETVAITNSHQVDDTRPRSSWSRGRHRGTSRATQFEGPDTLRLAALRAADPAQAGRAAQRRAVRGSAGTAPDAATLVAAQTERA